MWTQCQKFTEKFKQFLNIFGVKFHTFFRQHHPELVNSPYYCTDCNRHFGTNRKLRDHMTGAHFKTRPYKCRAGDQICDKAFYNVNLRRKHERQVHQLHIYTPSGTKSNKIVDLLNPIDQQQQQQQEMQ